MQFYVMLMQITLDLKLGKIFKNAALFSVISLFRNILMMVIIAVLLAGTFLLYIVGMSSASFTIIAALMLLAWVFIIFGFIFYMNSAIAYPAIQQYVIDPYYSENQAETSIGITAADVTEDAASRMEGEDEDELPEYVYHNGRMVHRSVFENDNIFND
jgi:predicted membrane protein